MRDAKGPHESSQMPAHNCCAFESIALANRPSRLCSIHRIQAGVYPESFLECVTLDRVGYRGRKDHYVDNCSRGVVNWVRRYSRPISPRLAR